MGRDCARCEGVPAVFQEYFLTRYPRTEVLAVGGESRTAKDFRRPREKKLSTPKAGAFRTKTS